VVDQGERRERHSSQSHQRLGRPFPVGRT
jgi:hypothetical protein